ncbi:hypothetical protein AVEN_5701-1 [Araneus ventricosus]|uniref:Uncharacterized protein n=1 Tax=Araneus ventricosus TaxID=182803 RepID=A0A4Y2DX08_ARAVE|nr:hypothetical protein AVEN_5701-1 [Araneus ventricosus]
MDLYLADEHVVDSLHPGDEHVVDLNCPESAYCGGIDRHDVSCYPWPNPPKPPSPYITGSSTPLGIPDTEGVSQIGSLSRRLFQWMAGVAFSDYLDCG